MTYVLTQTQIDELRVYREAEDYAGMYQAVYELSLLPDANGNALEDIDVARWFQAAAQANANSGSFASELIRDYTSAQVSIRSGSTQGVSTEHMNHASNTLAKSIWERLQSCKIV